MKQFQWWLRLLNLFQGGMAATVMAMLTLLPSPVFAQMQVIPDDDWGDENTQVIPVSPDRLEIDGGARRDSNLFHSFQEFNIDSNLSLYFRNPLGVENILTRITGTDPSDILGTLGVLGEANLFLMNPNGIVFGPGATLDLRGAFVATTSNALQFGNQGVFDTTTPQAPPLLTIDPSVLQFNQPPAPITVQPGVTLMVPTGESLLLVGGNLSINQSTLQAAGGRIELGAVAAPTSVGLTRVQGDFSLVFPETGNRGNISLTGRQQGTSVLPNVSVAAAGGGAIALYAHNLTLADSSRVIGGIAPNQPTLTAAGASITVDATGSVRLENNSRITTATQSGGSAGHITMEIDGTLRVERNSRIDSNFLGGDATNFGDRGGDITIQAGSIELIDGGYIRVNTNGVGDAGTAQISAANQILLSGCSLGSDCATDAQDSERSAISAGVGLGASGRGGTIQVTTDRLRIEDSAQIDARNDGLSQGGNINVTANEIELLSGGRITTRTQQSGVAGNLTINTNGGSIFISGRVEERESGLFVDAVPDPVIPVLSDLGPGGDMTINTGTLHLAERAEVSARTEGTTPRALGGDITINADDILVESGARIIVRTTGAANAGNIILNVDDGQIRFTGRRGNRESGLSAEVTATSSGDGGNVRIVADLLRIDNLAQINALTQGSGNGGDITVYVSQLRLLSGGRILANTEENSTGNAGDIRVDTSGGDIFISGRRDINDQTYYSGLLSDVTDESRGNGGDINVITGTLQIENSGRISARNGSPSSRSEGGTIRLDANRIDVLSSGRVITRTLGRGSGGDIIVNTHGGSINLSGSEPSGSNESGFFADSLTGAAGPAGSITITTGSLELSELAEISGRSRSRSTGGNITITANQIEARSGGTINANAQRAGPAGTITIHMNGGDILLSGGRQLTNSTRSSGITATTQGAGNAGSIIVTGIGQLIVENGAEIAATASEQSTGIAGGIQIEANHIHLRDNGEIEASSQGTRRAGNLEITAPSLLLERGRIRAISATTTGGSITLNGVTSLIMRDQSDIAASTRDGEAGQIQINVNQPPVNSIELTGGSNILTQATGTGSAGNLAIHARQIIMQGNSSISAETRSGVAGGIILQGLDLLQVINSEISASTRTGQAGNLTIQGEGAIQVDGLDGRLAVEATNGGTAGNLIIDTEALTVTNGARVTVSSTEAGLAGNLEVNAEQIRLSNGAGLTAETEDGSGANIRLWGVTLLQLADNSIISASTQNGEGGNLQINAGMDPTGSITVRSGSQIATAATGTGNAGALFLTTGALIVRGDQSSISAASQSGVGGNIEIEANSITVRNEATISAASQSGIGGDIGIQAEQVLVRNGGQILASSISGAGGSITLDGLQTLEVRNGAIASSTETGQAGSLTVNASDSIVLANQGNLSVAATDGGQAGTLALDTDELTLQTGAQVTVSSTAAGQAGNLEVTAEDVRLNNGSGLTAETEDGSGANIQLWGVNVLRLSNDSIISASTQDGEGGNLRINAGMELNGSITVNSGSQIATAATRTGDAGNLSLTTGELIVQGNGSSISAASRSGTGGNLEILAERVIVRNGGQILASSVSGVGGSITLNGLQTLQVRDGAIASSTTTGDAGNLTVTTSDSIQLDQRGYLSVAATEGGQAGTLALGTERLTVQRGAQATVSSTGIAPEGDLQQTAQAGDLRVNARTVVLNNDAALTATTQTGAGGDIQLQVQETLRVTQNSVISAATEDGRGGQLTINAGDRIEVRQGSQIATNAQGVGIAGDLTLNTEEMVIQDNSSVLATSRSRRGGDITVTADQLTLENDAQISAASESGRGGDITVTADQLTLEDDAEISASTQIGRGGSIRVQEVDQLTVTDSRIVASATGSTGQTSTIDEAVRAGNLTITANSIDLRGEGGLSVEAQDGGAAGNLTIRTTTLDLSDGADVSVSSPTGQAGTLSIDATSIRLDESSLTAETGESGATIELQNLDTLILRNGSFISANALDNANGGNMQIESDYIIAVPNEDSDIRANAFEGRGGNIFITTQGLFGIVPAPAPIEGISDITASSERGVQGVVVIDTPEVDPSRGLLELPTNVVDPSTQVAQGCSPSGSRVATEEREFVITGRGGLPPNPSDSSGSQVVLTDWATLESEENLEQGEIQHGQLTVVGHETLPELATLPGSDNPLIEAQGWVVNPQGEVRLITALPEANAEASLISQQISQQTCPPN